MESFVEELGKVFRAVERGHLAFVDAGGTHRGFIQLIWGRGGQITIHRIWTLEAQKGYGSIMLRALCDVADRHGVELSLKVIPIGRKPHPLTRDQLLAWYQRHGFEGSRRKMIRKPRPKDSPGYKSSVSGTDSGDSASMPSNGWNCHAGRNTISRTQSSMSGPLSRKR